MKLQNLFSWARSAVARRERARRLIAAGDRARDRGEWAVAARHYEKALALDPNRAPIWVQYGHALKEQGDLAGSEAAYRKSIGIDEANADTHLQLGHVLKLQGRKTDAISAYLGALLRDPEFSEPRRELAALDYPLTDFQAVLADLADAAPPNLVQLGLRADSAERRVAALLARSEAWARAQFPDFCVVDVSLASAVGWAFLPFDFHHSVLVNVYRGNRLLAAMVANLRRPAAIVAGPKYNWFQIDWKDWRYQPTQTDLTGLVFQRGEDGAIAANPRATNGAPPDELDFEYLLRAEFLDAAGEQRTRCTTRQLSARGLIQLYYFDYLGRLPDPDGLNVWLRRLTHGRLTVDRFRSLVLSSEEFRRREIVASDRLGHMACTPYLGLYDRFRFDLAPPPQNYATLAADILDGDDAAFLRRCYADILYRDPAQKELDDLHAELAAGNIGRLDLLRQFVLDAADSGKLLDVELSQSSHASN
jgi:tetratricopeptide (TPR) repeat protein